MVCLQLRELSYQLDQEKEAVRSGQASGAALREQMVGLEERLAREMELHQTAELQRREAELQAHKNLVLSQQLQDQISELTSQLHSEREAKAVQVKMSEYFPHILSSVHITPIQEGLYKEQVRLFRELQGQSSRLQEQKTEVTGQLQEAQSGRQNLEEKLQCLQRDNTQLQVELSGERSRGEEVRGRLEGEVQEMRERLREKTEKLVSAEDALLTSRQQVYRVCLVPPPIPRLLYLQFECNLSELRGKVDTLSSGMDTATSVRKQLESESEQLRTQLDKATRTLQATSRRCVCCNWIHSFTDTHLYHSCTPYRSAAKEKELHQSLEVQRGEREKAECELAGLRARLDQVTSQNTVLEARLDQLEREGRDHAGQVLARTSQITVLQKETDQWQQRVSAMEDSLAQERVRAPPQTPVLDDTCSLPLPKAVSTEASSKLESRGRELAAVQAEVARLTEQLASAQQRLKEKEASACQEQSRTDKLLESLRGDYNHSKSSLEERWVDLP